MLVMEEMQPVYLNASRYHRIFSQSINSIFPGYSVPKTDSNAHGSGIATEGFLGQDSLHEGEDIGYGQAFDVENTNFIIPYMEEVLFSGFWSSTE